jgi:hypothetical protein
MERYETREEAESAAFDALIEQDALYRLAPEMQLP